MKEDLLYFKRYKILYNFKTFNISKYNRQILTERGLPIVPFGPIYFYPSNILKLITHDKNEYLILAYLSDSSPKINCFCIKNDISEDGIFSCWMKNGIVAKQPILINSNISNFLIIFESFYFFFRKYNLDSTEIEKKCILSDFKKLTNLMLTTDKLNFTAYFWREYWSFVKSEWYGEFLLDSPNPIELKIENDKTVTIFEKNSNKDDLPF